MHVLVTGGCGFIGSHLIDRLLADGHTVTVLDDLSSGHRENLHPAAQLVQGDVADGTLVTRLAAGADAVFHLAAIASVERCEREPEHAYRTNVLGTEQVLSAAALAHIPVVYASSAAVYGDNPALPLREDEQPAPLGAYGNHKLENERTAARYAASHGLKSVGLRFFNVYGPRQDPRSPYSGVISKFMALASACQPLTFFGDGEQTRDFIYVADIVALLLAAQPHAGEALVFNGCTGRATSLNQLAEALATVFGRPLPSQRAAERMGDIRHSLGDPRAARSALAFDAQMGLVEGLGRLRDASRDR